MRSRRALARCLLPVVLLLSACSGGAPDADMGSVPTAAASPAPTEVEKQIFGAALPESAKGQELYLYTVVIPAGAELAAHTHPGQQLGHIEEGTLTYTIVEGEVEVIRQAGTPEGSVEQVAAGETIELEAGDTVVETKGMVHQAANRGDEPVRVLLASLFPEGAELSSPAPAPSPAV